MEQFRDREWNVGNVAVNFLSRERMLLSENGNENGFMRKEDIAREEKKGKLVG